jgi:hypothetical protein
MAAAVPPNTTVRRHTAKISLPCDRRTTHGNYRAHGKDGEENTAKGDARQRYHRAHGKDTTHGKGPSKRTAKNMRTAKVQISAVRCYYAVSRTTTHGKGAFDVRYTFAVRLLAFSLFFHFYFILLTTYLYFLISFIYLLVLLNTMCIYPPFCNTISSSPLPKYIGVSEQTLARHGLSPSIFQSVIACVPTGWSHL